jgi:hypothetical protein
LSTILAILTSTILFFTAVGAYIVFYYSYVPARGFTRPIYLQFSSNHAPYGYASISKALVSYQPYDVKVLLHMPRTPSNKAAGNFMIDLRLIAPGNIILDSIMEDESKILAKSTRPAILNYKSLPMELVHQGAALPWHLIGWREEAEVLRVSMFEGVEFPKGWRNIPDQIRLELQSDERLQVYSAQIEITARLRNLRYVCPTISDFTGLTSARYLMFTWRITSFFVLTTVFWVVELAVAATVWASLSVYMTYIPPHEQVKQENMKQEPRIKDEEDEELSDTPHTFPTQTGQPPLRYASQRIKQEDEDADLSTEQPAAVGEQADDEDEDADFVRDDLGRGFTDSGIGTSMESSGPGRNVRRRRSGHLDGE